MQRLEDQVKEVRAVPESSVGRTGRGVNVRLEMTRETLVSMWRKLSMRRTGDQKDLFSTQGQTEIRNQMVLTARQN